MDLWRDLLSNLAVVALATGIWTLGHQHVGHHAASVQRVLLGLVMGVGTFVCMYLPFKFGSGVFLDTRYTFLAISGFFGGPLAAALPLAVALIRRIMVGGDGLTVAIPQILAATSIGLYGFKLVGRRTVLYRHLLALGFCVSLSGTLGFYFKIPQDRWAYISQTTTLPLGLILFVSVVLAGVAILQERRRYEVTSENRMYRSVIEALPDCLNAKDLSGRFIVANPATAQMMNVATTSELVGRSDFDYYPKVVAQEFRRPEKDVIKNRKPFTVEQKFTRADGGEAWLSTLKAPLFDEAGDLVGVVTHNREITEQKRLEQELAQVQRRLEDAIASMADGLAMFDQDQRLIFHNKRLLELFPLSADVRQPGRSLAEITRISLERGEEKAVKGCMDAAVERTTHALASTGDRTLHLADGRYIEARTRPSSDGGFLLVFADITAHREREARLRDLNQRLKNLANTDGLTELPNRRAFDAAFDVAVRNATERSSDVSLLMIDVDKFKLYNDTYGHPQGDDCLQRIAARIQSSVRDLPGCMVARYGGEELAVILPGMNLTEGSSVGNLLCASIRELQLEHQASEKGIVTISVGAATLRTTAGSTKEEVLRKADEGLYHAKAAGRDCVRTAALGSVDKTSLARR